MRFLLLIGSVLLGLASGGCYYSQLASGQLKLLWARQPIARVLEDPAIPERTRSLLNLVPEVRDFARDLGLRVGNQYTSYVEWPGDRIVTTLVRTRPRSVEATPYWFPVVGNLPYKGYFDRARAETEASRLRDEEGFDVCVSGVSAYSTLGWMDDPVTSPMLERGAANLVETMLHEFVHATAFVSGNVDFNESVAQFVGQEATIAFFVRGSDAPSQPRPQPRRDSTVPSESDSDSALGWPSADLVRDQILDRRSIARATLALRERLMALGTDIALQAERKAAALATRAELEALPLRVLEPRAIAEQIRLNDACLALRGSYVRELPRHARLLETLDGDLRAMIRKLIRVADGELTPDEFYQPSDPLSLPIQSSR